MRTIVVKVAPGRVRLNEMDADGTVRYSTSFACDKDGDELLAWAKEKTPRSESVEFEQPAPAATGKKSKTK